LATKPSELRDNSRILFQARQPSSFTAIPLKPAPWDWPTDNWPNRGQFARESTAVFGDRNIRIREPSYSDYYAFGIRRIDVPPPVKNGFFCGGLPWYLPGSTTNFK